MAVERSGKRAIYSQGVFDGACFFYSLANAARCVTGKAVPEKAWARAIRKSPFRIDEFLSGDGTTRLDSSAVALTLAGRSFLDELGTELDLSVFEGDISSQEVAEAARRGQVIITAIDDGAHWVPIIDASETEAYIACSLALHDWSVQYNEHMSANKRVFNLTRTFEELKIWSGPSFIVSPSVTAV
jgi:hypothetical protein